MKRLVYAALAAMIILTGCYHPYYDGQKFRVYHADCGLVESDGTHIYIPVQSDKPYVLELYGGWGKKHQIKVEDPEYLDYSYSKESIEKTGLIDDPDMIPAGVTLLPKKLGDTAITLTEGDTKESITIYVHICEAFKALEVEYSNNSLPDGTVLAFRYGGVDDVVRICKGGLDKDKMEHIVDGKYAFVPYNSSVCMELTFPADAAGNPSAIGEIVTRRYYVTMTYGYPIGSASAMMERLHLADFPLDTKASSVLDTNWNLQFTDITDNESPDPESPDYKAFNAWSAVVIPWIE